MLKSLRTKIINDLRLNRGQFFAVWLVVMLGTALYGAMYPSGINMLASFYETYDSLNYMHYKVTVDPTEQGIASSIDDVEAVEERLVVETGLQIEPDSRYLISLRLISVPDDRLPMVNQSDVVIGRQIEADNEVLLLKSFADHHGIKVGDELMVWLNGEVHTLDVVGLAFNAEYLVAGRSNVSPFPTPSTFGIAWMRYTPLSEMAGIPGQVNEIVVHLPGNYADADLENETTIREALTSAYPGALVQSSLQTPSGGIVDALISGQFPVMIFFSAVFLLGSVVMTSVLLGRIVQSERRRIGTMRALGITRRELVMHYLSFGLLIGVSGGLVGTIFGYLNSFWVMSLFIHYIAGGTLPAFTNTPQIPFLLMGFMVALIGSVLAGMYPAWVESATSPGVALRPAMPKSPGKLSQVSIPFLPLVARQALRNILRSPGRSLSTALGVGLGAMMIFSAYAMWDSMQTSFADYFDSYQYDLRVDMGSFQPAAALENQIAAVDGVAAVQTALIGPVVLEYEGDRFDTFAMVVNGEDSFIDLVGVEGDVPFSHDAGVWIGNNVQRTMGVGTGDNVTLTALGQTHTVPVAGVISSTVGAPVYLPESLMVQWTPGGLFLTNTAFVRVKPGQDAVVRDALVDLPGMVAVEIYDEYRRDLDTYLLFFRVGTLIFGGFGYVLTLAVIFNTVNAALRERQDELAVLRAMGNTAGEIAAVVLIELLLMTALGFLIGAPLGRHVGFDLMHAYDTDTYGSLTTLLFQSYILGGLSLLLIVLVATVPGLRSVQRVDLGMVSKSQSI